MLYILWTKYVYNANSTVNKIIWIWLNKHFKNKGFVKEWRKNYIVKHMHAKNAYLIF